MIIEIKELCDHELGKDIRVVQYKSEKAKTLRDALIEYDSPDFDSDNIIYANDDFEGECYDSVIISAQIINE